MGREQERLRGAAGGGQWSEEALMRLSAGRSWGEGSGEKKGEAARGHKGGEAWGPGERGPGLPAGWRQRKGQVVLFARVAGTRCHLGAQRGADRESTWKQARRGRKQGRRSQAHRGSCPEAPVAQSTAEDSPAPSHSWGRVGQCGTARVNAVCSPCQSLAWLGPQGSPHMSPPLLPNPRLPAPPGPTPTLKEQAPAPVSSLPPLPPFLPHRLPHRPAVW